MHVLHEQSSELVRTIMMRILKQSVVGEKTGISLLSLDVDSTDNRLKQTEKWRLVNQLQKP